jgi:23S rRNA (uracil1939-C5)-methyltransferase
LTVERLTINRLGLRGEGVAGGSDGPIYVSYALPGEVVSADVDGDKGDIIELMRPRSDRVAPICPYFGACGGCAVQTLPA